MSSAHSRDRHRAGSFRRSPRLIVYFFIVAHNAASHTLSNACLKSMKTWYMCCWWCAYFSHGTLRLNICLPVFLPALNPACSVVIIAVVVVYPLH